MKKIIYLILFVISQVFFFACKDGMDLEVINKNEPTLITLETENGVMGAALGIHWPSDYWRFWWTVQGFHEIMGDNTYVAWGNYSWRWAQQNTWIDLDDGTRVAGGSQEEELTSRNTRGQQWDNPFRPEWQVMYYMNNQANMILDKLETTEFSGDAETKRSTLKAWCLWNKAFAYSRIGSIYKYGLIANEYGVLSDNYVDHNGMIVEANRLFDEAIVILQGLTDGGAYTSTLGNCVPSYWHDGGLPSPQEWIRSINSYKARNLLVNTRVADMTPADWNTVQTLADAGIQEGDAYFYVSDDPDLLAGSTMAAEFEYGWMFVSERMVQDFKPGDDRFTRNFVQTVPEINVRSRGIQFGSEWALVSDGDYSTLEFGLIKYAVGVSYEENELMLAEAKINSGDIDGGLAHIDAVRQYQNAQLADVANTGLTLAQAKEELRRERRIGLYTRGLAFYDARRWGVIDDVSAGGGRTGCWVWADDGTKNTNATFNYNYMSYWDVPANETDFNPITGVVASDITSSKDSNIK
jgi:hypothetical protein